MKCPCFSGKEYGQCCEPYHKGKTPPDVLTLLRSRCAAYTFKNVDYLLKTMHPGSPKELTDRKRLEEFCEQARMINLEILEVQEGTKFSYVTFRLSFIENGKEHNYVDRSEYEKLDGKWYFKDYVDLKHDRR